MKRIKISHKITALSAVFIIAGGFISARLYDLTNGDDIAAVSADRGKFTLSSSAAYGNIYDRSGQSFTNTEAVYYAVINPQTDDIKTVQPYINNREALNSGGNSPFLCAVSAEALNSTLTVFKTYKRVPDNLSAEHIIGYSNESGGVYGIEKAYNDLLRADSAINKITFNVDAVGGVLLGTPPETEIKSDIDSGVILTIDKDFQKIAEDVAAENGLKKGAVIIMDVKNGDILASASFPRFNVNDIAAVLDDTDAPLINRVMESYAVGSVFKLTAVAEALEEGISPEYTYTCRGLVDIDGQIFNCHSWGGHGQIDIREAVIQSCNPFFIALARDISLTKYLNRIETFGFGSSSILAPGIVGDAGNVPSYNELLVPAERANLSFGQGKLTATPLQICRFTAAIANGGILPEPRLVKGVMTDGIAENYPENGGVRVMSEETAKFLTLSMRDTLLQNTRAGLPRLTSAAGKTSTAQTGIIKSDGEESVNVWFTGFFPANKPQYAVTVLVEDGISGAISAAPIFAQCATQITTQKTEEGGQKTENESLDFS
ncbi:MAG: penicillin-binding protein 2 [Ruminococcus sp.]|jgi:penicillin-binding protein 2|nr:penicillin-binding protein 2 [Ruminococcus sp.]